MMDRVSSNVATEHAASRSSSLVPDDSPAFLEQASELGAAAERLDKRCGRLIRGSRRYRDSISATSRSQTEFAETLRDFCGGADGTDEESMSLGSGTMSRFIGIFDDLSHSSELLKSQVDTLLVEQIHDVWQKQLLLGARNCASQLASRSEEYDEAQKRYLGHRSLADKMLGKKIQPEADKQRVHAEAVAAAAAAQEARYELARSLTEVEGRKRHEFLSAVVSVMDGHLRFFKQGYEALSKLEPYIHQVLESCDAMKHEEEQRLRALGDTIFELRSQQSSRDVRRADAAARATPRPQGPLQMSGAAATLKASVEGQIRKTFRGGPVNIIRSGYLLKKGSGLRKEWARRYFELDSAGMLDYRSSKDKLTGKADAKAAANRVALQTATVKAGAEEASDAGLQYCFRVVSQSRSYVLQAEDDLDATEWIDTIQAVIACMLELPTPPAPPALPPAIQAVTSSSAAAGGTASPRSPSPPSLTSVNPGRPPPSPQGVHSGRSRAAEAANEVRWQSSGPSSVGNMSFAAESSVAADAGSVRSSAPSETGDAEPEQATSQQAPQQAAPNNCVLSEAGSLGGGGSIGGSDIAGEALVVALAAVRGNDACADCGAASPEWASLNLGVLICAACAGIHRRLGVHISKVRSLTLDEKVWERSVVALFKGLGNAYANAAWEDAIMGAPQRSLSNSIGRISNGNMSPWQQSPMAGAVDSNTAFASSRPRAGSRNGSFDGAEISSAAWGNRSRRSSQRSLQGSPGDPGGLQPFGAKPLPEAPHTERDAFICAKYVRREFASPGWRLPGGSAQAALWDAAQHGDVRAGLRAFASGADVDARYAGPLPAQLVAAVTARMQPPLPQLEPGATGDVTALHCAAFVGLVPLLELLLQNGARTEWADAAGRQALHYAVLASRTEAAKLLVRRGAPRFSRDITGRSPLDVLLEQPTVADRELLFWLSITAN